MSYKFISLFFFILILNFFSDAFAATQVIDFKPNFSVNETESGYCWSHAITSGKNNAWRCTVGNAIQDPCFSDDKQQVVCGQSPMTQDKGFRLKLTKPLPTSAKTSADDQQYWIIELADNTICYPFTGTLPPVEDRVTYGCGNPKIKSIKKVLNACTVGIVDGSIKKDNTWTATKVLICRSTRTETGWDVVKKETININKIYK